MFEEKPTEPPLASHSAEEGELRALTWSDLRSRLDAARDLRSSLSGEEYDGPASFDALFVRNLAAQVHGKWSVNPDHLGNGKEPSGKVASRYDGDAGSDPRKT